MPIDRKRTNSTEKMETYLIFATVWTLYMAFETYVFSRPADARYRPGRPHVAGFVLTHMLLAPLSFVLSLTSGVLRERIETAYGAAWHSKRAFARTDRKKLIG